MSVFETVKKNPSVSIAKDRLKFLLVSDRMNCAPNAQDNLEQELYQVIAKYMEITPEEFHVQITRNQISIRIAGEKE